MTEVARFTPRGIARHAYAEEMRQRYREPGRRGAWDDLSAGEQGER